jgi:hypothetical protein
MNTANAMVQTALVLLALAAAGGLLMAGMRFTVRTARRAGSRWATACWPRAA